mmetsp:Transcript_35018/g.91647  ORF Transcript_35018/g.91647 Transcript_35018/m.91647 type:complete len:245 (-) Transcript_35018:195-929(-)
MLVSAGAVHPHSHSHGTKCTSARPSLQSTRATIRRRHAMPLAAPRWRRGTSRSLPSLETSKAARLSPDCRTSDIPSSMMPAFTQPKWSPGCPSQKSSRLPGILCGLRGCSLGSIQPMVSYCRGFQSLGLCTKTTPRYCLTTSLMQCKPHQPRAGTTFMVVAATKTWVRPRLSTQCCCFQSVVHSISSLGGRPTRQHHSPNFERTVRLLSMRLWTLRARSVLSPFSQRLRLTAHSRHHGRVTAPV